MIKTAFVRIVADKDTCAPASVGMSRNNFTHSEVAFATKPKRTIDFHSDQYVLIVGITAVEAEFGSALSARSQVGIW